MDDNDITYQIIGAAIEVHRLLGPGLLESAYEECLSRELELRNLKIERQRPIPVVYKDVKLECGYRIDLLVESRIVVELKSIEAFAPIHEAIIPDLYTPLRMPPRASHQFQRDGTERWDQTIHHLA
jgi:GxxExxY protein